MIYRFETFTFDVGRRELRRNGVAVAIEPQVFDLIHYLVRNRDRVVTRDDLVASVWKGRIVSDSALTSRIAVARQALDDCGEEQRLIRTIARKGVRFVAPVSEEMVATESTHVPPAFHARPTDLPDKPSIAVLPFVNLSKDPEQDYFVEGVMDEIVTALTRIRTLFVISSESSLALKGQPLAEQHTAAIRMGVRYLIEGSVRRTGDRVRISAKLIDTRHEAQIWAERFDDTLLDAFELQDRIALRVAGIIEPSVHEAEVQRAARRPIENLGCYDLYLRAAPLRGACRKSEVIQALKLLERAVALDPSFAPALAQAAGCHSQMYTNAWDENREWHRTQGLALAERAVKLGFGDASVLAQVANAVMELDFDIARAVALADRATELNPSCARAWFIRGLLSLSAADGDRAVQHFRAAARLDPLSPFNDIIRVHIGIGQVVQGDLPEALRLMRATTHRTARIHLILSAVCGLLGMRAESREELAQFRLQSSATVENTISSMTPNPRLRAMMRDGIGIGLEQSVASS